MSAIQTDVLPNHRDGRSAKDPDEYKPLRFIEGRSEQAIRKDLVKLLTEQMEAQRNRWGFV